MLRHQVMRADTGTKYRTAFTRQWWLLNRPPLPPTVCRVWCSAAVVTPGSGITAMLSWTDADAGAIAATRGPLLRSGTNCDSCTRVTPSGTTTTARFSGPLTYMMMIVP